MRPPSQWDKLPSVLTFANSSALIDRLFPPSTYSNRILETQTRSNSPQRSPAVGRLEIHPLANKSSPPLLSWALR
ncbi:hypothetical protein HZS61_009908 [Fusarium oxysporum f. sp. conglutinans]|uniref:Uncharacterized protein n=1 Tax=Fusarium oxysporum f. sp. conglutinans TaxID=100902 RepID=A0A8H6LNQ2_FUSOX|nr:hypothetical protein HZS61_009908 [Fusarium oxysporum f. sp. conglutinans]